MSTLQELERNVHQYLSNLAHVNGVKVEASITAKGKKKCSVCTYIDSDIQDNHFRVYNAEMLLMDKHPTVTFEFSCTLKEEDE